MKFHIFIFLFLEVLIPILLLILIPQIPPHFQHWSYHTGFLYFCKAIQKPLKIEICILAGGLSRRMGRNKAQLRLGGRTLLSHIRSAALASGLPVRVVLRDIVPRCGPLGGVVTALTRTRMDRVLFLPCDMPLISKGLILWVLRKAAKTHPHRNAFVSGEEGAGFPFVLEKSALPVAATQIEKGRYSLQELARRLGAAALRPPPPMRRLLQNVNTPQDWARLVEHIDTGRPVPYLASA